MNTYVTASRQSFSTALCSAVSPTLKRRKTVLNSLSLHKKWVEKSCQLLDGSIFKQNKCRLKGLDLSNQCVMLGWPQGGNVVDVTIYFHQYTVRDSEFVILRYFSWLKRLHMSKYANNSKRSSVTSSVSLAVSI